MYMVSVYNALRIAGDIFKNNNNNIRRPKFTSRTPYIQYWRPNLKLGCPKYALITWFLAEIRRPILNIGRLKKKASYG